MYLCVMCTLSKVPFSFVLSNSVLLYVAVIRVITCHFNIISLALQDLEVDTAVFHGFMQKNTVEQWV